MRVDLLMPASDDIYAALAAEEAAVYPPAFAAQGIELTPLPWQEAPRTGDAALALFAWGYHLQPERWAATLAAWPAERPLINPPALLAWNMRKTYLTALAERGVPIVPSWFGPATEENVAAAFARFGVDRLVVKPQVSAGSHETVRLRAGDPVPPIAEAIVQPYLPAIEAEGELSLLFIGGVFSHAVRKVPQKGDFRIQPQFGGRFLPATPSDEARAVAAAALAASPVPPLYARIDLVRLPNGALALMELEATEPDLYPDFAPDLPASLARAVAAHLRQGRSSGTART